MEPLGNEMVYIHQEFIRKEASLRLTLKQSGLVDPPLVRRFLPALGEIMCRVGTRLKEKSYRKLSPEEASAPTFMIML